MLQSYSCPTLAPGRAAETPLTLLGSVRELDDGELPQLYAYPDRDGTWVRANFITSIDGGATADGKTGAMGGARRPVHFQPAA